MSKKLHIVHVASEVEPFSKSGGLANVINALPKAHAHLKHKVVVISPLYEKIFLEKKLMGLVEKIGEENLEITAGTFKEVEYYRLIDATHPYHYFIYNKKYFGEMSSLYGAKHENARFVFFDVAALALLKFVDFKPDIINCHDWHSGLIPYFLKGRYKKDPFWEKTSTIFTIHNLTYQFGHNWWEIPQEMRDNGRTPLPPFADKSLEMVNFAKRAIINADAINAVSETYREEIMTKDFGQELHRILKNRESRVFGIVNGIDYSEYNPLTDLGLFAHYSSKSPSRKFKNKAWLQKFYRLEKNPCVPLICMTSRIVEQKGFMLLMKIVRSVLRLNVQIIIMGDGNKEIGDFFKRIEAEYPGKFKVVPFDHDRETSLYAGSDMFLLPSRFEPCGINQLIAMRYGTVPIVHHVGGLADTIVDFQPSARHGGKVVGNGFTFSKYNSREFLIAIVRALETFKHKAVWRKLVVHDLKEANSWLIPAKKYIELYRNIMRAKKVID